ncbi:hypothetical protein DYBT9275_06094 [Dyadobacter sp. CECT 9275]|uniref:RNA polymerase sigma-70 factor n=1 Tax=Dyadobacter helix TaxID=2822344 RepID=A0A916JIL4_9BACT|nr:RNA polymerase sigma-70 factor [Dyadobacter sp. CECT 9275]CAG5018898.1 hypothetical protein DYBT9275_06094 [Dyadobacter sp. CECT 9275]
MENIYPDSFKIPGAGKDPQLPDDTFRETFVTDDERLLRSTFALNPQKGCELLFRRYYINLCNHAVRFVHSKEIAEDIVSDVFAGFWQSRMFEQITTSYRAYLYKAIRHRSYNYIRWQLNKTTPLELVEIPMASQTISPDDLLQFSELHQQIEKIVQRLPPQCRRAYLLKRMEEKKYDEIAQELQISSKAVEALVSRALVRLRNELKDDWFLGGLALFYIQL